MAAGVIKHVYFGPKDPNTGEMLPEPVYEYQEYPRDLYALVKGELTVITIKSDEEYAALPPGWVKNPLELGVETCPGAQSARKNEFAIVPDPLPMVDLAPVKKKA
jgi:hypothetical protein